MKRVLPSNTKILCCIATKNAEKTIVGTLESISNELLFFISEIVVIDNASSDQTVQMAKVLLASDRFRQLKVSIFQNSANYGLGGSHKVAFKYALDHGFDYLFVIHGDQSSNPNQFLKIFLGDFFKFDMILSSRLSNKSVRTNFQNERLLLNRLLSLCASLICCKRIDDFSAGGLNLFRVQSFINKYENPLKYFSNDVSFVQFLTLYSVYRRNKFYYHAVDCCEPDQKSTKRMVSQFLKAIVLLMKFRFQAHKTIMKDIYGTYFGHNYRKIKIKEEIADLIPEETNIPTVEFLNLETAKEDVQTSDVKFQDVNLFKFTDLRRLAIKDKYSESFNEINFSVISSIEKRSKQYLSLNIELDANNLIGQGLKALMLRLFKVYPAKKLFLILKANENILKTKQCFEFIEFLSRFKVNFLISSDNPSNQKLWSFYSGKASALMFNFEYGIIHRSEFYSLAKSLSAQNRLFINISTSVDKFYYGFGLLAKLNKDRVGENTILLPYENVDKAADHQALINNQDYSFNLEKLHLKFTHTQRSGHGNLTISSSEQNDVTSLHVDSFGNLVSKNSGSNHVDGNIFNENSFEILAL